MVHTYIFFNNIYVVRYSLCFTWNILIVNNNYFTNSFFIEKIIEIILKYVDVNIINYLFLKVNIITK